MKDSLRKTRFFVLNTDYFNEKMIIALKLSGLDVTTLLKGRIYSKNKERNLIFENLPNVFDVNMNGIFDKKNLNIGQIDEDITDFICTMNALAGAIVGYQEGLPLPTNINETA